MQPHKSTITALQHFGHSQITVATPTQRSRTIPLPNTLNPWRFAEDASLAFGGLVFTNARRKTSSHGTSVDTIVVVDFTSDQPFILDSIKHAVGIEAQSETYLSSKVTAGDTFTILDSCYFHRKIAHHCCTKYESIRGGEMLRQISTTVVSEDAMPTVLRQWTIDFHGDL